MMKITKSAQDDRDTSTNQQELLSGDIGGMPDATPSRPADAALEGTQRTFQIQKNMIMVL
jgi:hypothetical protein